jgi:serine/threonine protein kinase
MERFEKWKNDYSYLCGGWLRKLTDWVLKLWSALVAYGVNATAALQTTLSRTELHTERPEATDRSSKSDNELGKRRELAKRMMDRLISHLLRFNEHIRTKNKIISELKEKLRVQKVDGKEAGRVNNVTVTINNAPKKVGVNASDFDFVRVLGTGGFASVFLVQKRGGTDDGRLYAMKVLENDLYAHDDNFQCTVTELRILNAIRRHPFLTTLHYVFHTEYYLCIVLDYMSGGDLYAVSRDRGLDEYDVRVYIGEVILALEHLHKLGVMHRDVKLENILLDSEGHAVLSDFGLSKMFLPDEKRKAHTWCGTLVYMAPELVSKNSEGYNMAVDWWSLGIVTYELLTGRSPFERQGKSETDKKMYERIIMAEPLVPDNISLDAVDFLMKLLVKDPQKRLGGGRQDAEELKSHPFLKGINWSDLSKRKIWAPFVYKKTKKNTTSVTDDSNLIDPAEIFDTLPTNYDMLHKADSYVSESDDDTKCEESEIISEHTADSYRTSSDDFSFEYIPTTGSAEMEPNDAESVDMGTDWDQKRRISRLRAAKENIESLEAELLKESCVQSRYDVESERPKTGLRYIREKVMKLEVELNEENCLWKRRNKGNRTLQTDIKAAIRRIEKLKTDLIEANCME